MRLRDAGMSAQSKAVVLVVGNPLVKSDSMPVRLLPLLQKARPDLEFVFFEPTRMDIPHKQDLTFIDTVAGLKQVCLLHGVEALAGPSGAYSLHDFDLAGQLLLLSKFGLLGQVHIIGVPAKGKTGPIAKDVLRGLNGIRLFRRA